jgi:hypothetical protein
VARVGHPDADRHRLPLGVEHVAHHLDLARRRLARAARHQDRRVHARDHRRGLGRRHVAHDEHLVEIGHRGDRMLLVGADLLARRGVELHDRPGAGGEHPVARVAVLPDVERAQLGARGRGGQAGFFQLALRDHHVVLRRRAGLDEQLEPVGDGLLRVDGQLRGPQIALHRGQIAAAHQQEPVALLDPIADVHPHLDDAPVERGVARGGAGLDRRDAGGDRVARERRAHLGRRGVEFQRHLGRLHPHRLALYLERQGARRRRRPPAVRQEDRRRRREGDADHEPERAHHQRGSRPGFGGKI